jgi:endo-1,4-beta-xylanase
MSVSFAMVERQNGVFDFSIPDKIVEFAIAHNAKVKGHSLVFASAIPDWVTKGNFTPDQLSEILKTHVQTIARHFKEKYPGTVIAWQVVNEVTCNGGAFVSPDACPEGIKNIIWTNVHKPNSSDPRDYIELAFNWAHEADPDAKLYLNEDGIEWDSHPKKDRVYSLVKYLKSVNAPIDGIGFEGHVRLFQKDKITTRGLLETMNRYAALGLESQITEIDVMMCSGVQPNTSPTVPIPIDNPTPGDYMDQAKVYRTFLDACILSKKCTAFTVGATYDPAAWTANYWKGSFRPHLFDDSMKPKIAYRYMVDDIKKADQK